MKNLLYTLIFLNILNFGYSDENKPETFMWEVTSPVHPGKVYLLGSIHVADDRLYPLHPAIETAFEESSALVLEIVIDKVNPLDMMQYLTYKDERTLESELPKDIYEKIAKMFEENNIPKYMYNKFKPWFAVITLQSDAFKGAGFTSLEGIDMYFLKKAREKKIDVLEIETLESQIQLLEDLDEFTGDYLRSVLEDFGNPDSTMDKVLEAWKTGDDSAMEGYMANGSETEEFADIMEKLNFERNENMSDKIEEYLQNERVYFVVVGSAHLIGSRGVVNILKETNKYKIKRY